MRRTVGLRPRCPSGWHPGRRGRSFRVLIEARFLLRFSSDCVLVRGAPAIYCKIFRQIKQISQNEEMLIVRHKKNPPEPAGFSAKQQAVEGQRDSRSL